MIKHPTEKKEITMPEISVVIPLYNKRDTINRCIDSVLAQTVQDIEIIVIFLPRKDMDNEDSDEKVAQYRDERIRLMHQENKGVSAARNQGVKAARADLIAFIDADDEWTPKHLETLLRLREKFPEAGTYGTATLITNGVRTERIECHPEIPDEPWEGLIPNYWKAAHRKYFPIISTSNVAVPRDVLIEMDGFNTGLSKGEDLDLWGRIAVKYPIAFSWDGKGVYHTESPSRLTDERDRAMEMPSSIVVQARKALKAGEIPSHLRADILRHIENIQIDTAWINLKNGRPDLAKKNIKDIETRYRWAAQNWTLFWTFVPKVMFDRIFRAFSKVLRK